MKCGPFLENHMNLYQTFGTSVDAEVDGVPVCFGADESKDPTFIVRRLGGRNRRYGALLQAKTKPYTRLIQSGKMDSELQEKIYKDVFIETVLISWKNVTDRSGKPLEFSAENARKLFTDLPDLFEELVSQAGSAETFRAEALEDVAKK